MPFLLRVSLPDVPGSLGRVASAIGEAGGDIQAIEIVEKTAGAAVDDVLLETAPGVMPDSIVSACSSIEGVEVLWISRYAAGGNLFLDLEVVEELTLHPSEALERVVDLLPVTFRVDWAVRLRPDGDVVRATEAAPASVAYPRPQTSGSSIHPSSGSAGQRRWKERPERPTSRPLDFSSSAHRPNPCSSQWHRYRSSCASLSPRVSGKPLM